jgi:hypothetical protein
MYFADEEGHKAVANTLALVNAGIMKEDGTAGNTEIRGGKVIMGSDGTPTGYLIERAGTYTQSFLDNECLYSVDIAKSTLPEIEEHLLSEGYTMYIDGWGDYFYNDNFYEAAHDWDKAGDMHFLLGMTYEIESNRKSGYGRFDIGIFPDNKNQNGVIMEFKVADTEAALSQTAKIALDQIENLEYITEFRNNGVDKVWKYGIAFCGKKCEIAAKV